jgi:hypothetical protein
VKTTMTAERTMVIMENDELDPRWPVKRTARLAIAEDDKDDEYDAEGG